MCKKIAILLTCHNRRSKTISCLDSVFNASSNSNLLVDVYLVDDGSTDGTSDAIQQRYQSVNILDGDGSLYWSGGMRLAFKEAMKGSYDFYLWLNDDCVLFENSLVNMLHWEDKLREEYKSPCIVVGSMIDPISKLITYGGNIRVRNLFNQIKMKRINPDKNGKPILIQCMNGNCALIPKDVANSLGNIDHQFVHALGDYDYSLRGAKKGINTWLISAVGECENDHVNEGDTNLSIKDRWRRLVSPTGLPMKPWFVYCKRHAGVFWPFIWIKAYLRALGI